MSFDFGGLLQQYLGGAGSDTNTNAAQAEDHFGQVAQSAPSPLLTDGLSAAFRSDQTPPFGQMVSQLFGNGNSQQQIGMIGQLLASLTPAAIAALSSSGVLSNLMGSGGKVTTTPTPEQIKTVTPDQVAQIATQAEQHSPSVVDKMSEFYAQHTGLVKTIGGAALAIALAKMANGMKNSA